MTCNLMEKRTLLGEACLSCHFVVKPSGLQPFVAPYGEAASVMCSFSNTCRINQMASHAKATTASPRRPSQTAKSGLALASHTFVALVSLGHSSRRRTQGTVFIGGAHFNLMQAVCFRSMEIM